MKSRSAIILLAVLMATAAWAQQEHPVPLPASYEALLAELKGGKTDIDYYALRMAFTETDKYQPYEFDDEDARSAMFRALDQKNYDEALAQADKALAYNYLDARAHAAAEIAHRRLGHESEAAFHRAVALGLVRSIFHAGDGHTKETAAEVISTDEEYTYLMLAGFEPRQQSLIHDGEHSYDKMVAFDPETKQEITFYFQIDKPIRHLAESLKPGGKK